MEEADDWRPVPAEADDWQPVTKAQPTPQIDADYVGTGLELNAIPQPFLDRVARGQSLSNILKKAGEGIVEGWGEGTPTGMSDETLNSWIASGIFHDPTKQRAGPIQLLAEGGIQSTAKAIETLARAANAGFHGAGEAWGQLLTELGEDQGMANRATNETVNLGNYLMLEAGFGRFARPRVAGRSVVDEQVGSLPREADFKNGAAILKTPEAEARLKAEWNERGVHPAEAIHDAQHDAFLRHDLTARAEEVKPPKEMTETWPAPVPHSLGSAVNDLPFDIPLSVQPPSAPGNLSAAVRAAGEKLGDVGHNIQIVLTPMATGTQETMAIAKDFANGMRRNRWEWSRIDDDIAKRFNAEQRASMWIAADEESVMRQIGERDATKGLATLAPGERAAVEDLQARAQNAWLKAKDLGMVQGEGLPAYTPRMVLNVAGASSEEGAIALNALGSNVRTRSSGLMSRTYLTAEETEAAAKRAFGEKAELARDIRTLPLSTAQLEDAVAGRTLINSIKEHGERSGTLTVSEGIIPADEAKWFTIDHPAFKTWRPKLEYKPNGEPVLEGNALKVVKDAEGNTVFEQVPLYIHGDFEGPLRAVLTSRNGAVYSAFMEVKAKTMSLIMNSPLIHNAVEFGRAFPTMPVRIFTTYLRGNRAKYDLPLMREAIDNGLVPIGHRFFRQDINAVMEAPDLTPGRSWTSQVLAAVPGLFDEAAGTAVKRAIDKAGDFWHNTLLWDRVADLQMGLYSDFRGDLIAKGVDQQTASRVAAHLANRYAGALPQEAMSNGARKVSNFLMFSRTFTVGNWGVLKDTITGLPRDVLAQIQRDMGHVDPTAVGYAKALSRRKAMSAVVLDIGLLYVANSVFQSALNVMLTDTTLDQEMHGYVRRWRDMVNETNTHPLSLVTPLTLAGGAIGASVGGPAGAIMGAVGGAGIGVLRRLSATYDNEPGKEDRLKVGYAKDGTALYARSPFGKIGEEYIGYLNNPIDMLKRKEGTLFRPLMETIANDRGFGRKVYNPHAESIEDRAHAIWQIVEHFAKAQTPEGQISAFTDLVKGEGDAKVNALQAFAPFVGFTGSKGAPGGPATGELYHARAQYQYAVDAAMPDLRKQILRGDVAGARRRMQELGMNREYQNWVVRTAQNPALRISPKVLRDFYRYAAPEQKARLMYQRGQAAGE